MLKLEAYYNEEAISYVKNHKEGIIRKIFNDYSQHCSVEYAKNIGWSLLRNCDTKEEAVYGLGWLLKSIDIYEKHEYEADSNSHIFDNPEQMEKEAYVRSLEGVSSALLPKSSKIYDVLKTRAQKYIEPNPEIGLEYLLKAVSFDCVSAEALLNLSVAYFDGLFGKPDYIKALYYLETAISKDSDCVNSEFVASYKNDIQQGMQ